MQVFFYQPVERQLSRFNIIIRIFAWLSTSLTDRTRVLNNRLEFSNIYFGLLHKVVVEGHEVQVHFFKKKFRRMYAECLKN